MNVAVWIVSGLAALFLMAGVMKLARSKAQLLENPSMGWTEDFPPTVLKFIGLAEVAGAAGLILSGALDVATWLVPAAATGLVGLMVGAGLTHRRRHEYPNLLYNLGLFALAVLVATERIGAESF
jgi:hypothetical protein